MSEPFVGEIRMFGGNFAPRGWALCDGQLLSISTNDALFSLLGTIYGGDGRTTFGLPDLRGRVPIHLGQGPGLSNRRIGAKTGLEKVTVTTGQLPQHSHPSATEGSADSGDPGAQRFADTSPVVVYGEAEAGGELGALASAATPSRGRGGSHNNLAPFQAIHFIIALFGIYPSRN